MKTLILKTILAVGVAGALVIAQTPPPPEQPAAQGTMATDSGMTSKVRQALNDDTTVGTAAHNIRVSTHNGMVTLRGKVDSASEKDAALAKAREIAGDANVKDEITVKK